MDRMINKDALIMEVLKTFKEHEYSRNTLIKDTGTKSTYKIAR